MNKPAPANMTAMDRIDEMLSKLSPEQQKKLDELLAEELAQPWLPTPGPQLNAFQSNATLLLYGGAAGGGKGLPKNRKVLTPFGFREIGDLKVGSNICTTDGRVQQIIGYYERGVQSLYRLKWSDGTETECDSDHIWVGWRTGKMRKIGNVRSTGESSASKWTTKAIADYYERSVDYTRNNRFAIPVMSEPCAFNVHGFMRGSTKHVSREIPPYVLGVILGDGHIGKGNVVFCSADLEIPTRVTELVIDAFGPSSQPSHYKSDQACQSYRIPNNPILDHMNDLDLVGCLAENKFIPRIYLMAGIDERFELLAGLMDTDGWVDLDGDCYFCTVSKQLAEDVRFLARSLGAIVTWREKDPTYTYKGEKLNGQHAYTLRIKIRQPERMFRLARKIVLCKDKEPQSMGLFLESIERCGEGETVCIEVSHPNSLYVIDDFIVTHNTDLICGLAIAQHHRTVVFRAQSTDLAGFWERLEVLVPNPKTRNVNLKKMTTQDDRLIECGHLDAPGSEEAWRGRRHDLIAFDEAASIAAAKINFVLGWLGSPDGHRCRAILATNPPIGAQGAWLTEWFAPWIDPFYPKPALVGELRWCVTAGTKQELKTIWVDGPEDIYLNPDYSWRLATKEEIDKQPRLSQVNKPQSRTFVPALLDDNPYLRDTDYRAQLQAKPEPLRSQLLLGSFLAGREDHEWQVIPTDWVREAQKRWKAPRKIRMLSLGVDVAQGGQHKTSMSALYDDLECYIFDRVLSWPGSETPDGPSVANKVLLARRDGAKIAMDMTGGWGGSARDHLRDNHQIFVIPIVFSAAAVGGDKQTGYGYANLRAKMYWRFRTALDPSGEKNPDFKPVALPPGDKIIAQLSAAHWHPRSGKIVIESKEEIQARLGSSPDEADAIVEAWHVKDMALKTGRDGAERGSGWAPGSQPGTRSARLGWMS